MYGRHRLDHRPHVRRLWPVDGGGDGLHVRRRPDTPHQGCWWEMIEKYKINILYTAPTAIRTFIKWGDEWVDKYDISSLRLLGTVGEGINPEAWMWYHRKIGGYAARSSIPGGRPRRAAS